MTTYVDKTPWPMTKVCYQIKHTYSVVSPASNDRLRLYKLKREVLLAVFLPINGMHDIYASYSTWVYDSMIIKHMIALNKPQT